MPTTYRAATKGDVAAITHLLKKSYLVEGPRADADARSWITLADTRVMRAGSHTVACGQLIPFRMHLGGRIVKMGGIAAVAGAMEDRRHGYVGSMLVGMLQEMRRTRTPWSILFPFSAPFYARYGWGTAEERRIVTLPAHSLVDKAAAADGRIAEGGPQSIAVCDRLYRTWAARYNHSILRSRAWWNDAVLARKHRELTRYLYIAYDKRGAADGYVVFSYKTPPSPSPWDTRHLRECVVRELVYTTPRARRALLAFLGNLDSQVGWIVWRVPPDDPHTATHPTDALPRIKTELSHMTRVVDVTRAFDGVPSLVGPQLRAVIEVQDEYAPWNNGRWEFTTDDASVLRVRATRAGSDARVSINLLSQIASGYVSVDALLDAGLVEGSHPDSVALIAGVSGGRPTYMTDGF